MTPNAKVRFREATSADVPAMVLCRSTDPTDGGIADPRMAAYLDGQHHPGEALPPRVGYVATLNNDVIGYIAGHRTTRNGCSGELQYLFVAPAYRRRRIGTALLLLLAGWFETQGVRRVCVSIAADSPPEARPFCEAVGAVPLKQNWYFWEYIDKLLTR
jgi:GNAT superfamily N-acetyltransferase